MTIDSSTTNKPETPSLPDMPPAAQWMAALAAQNPPMAEGVRAADPHSPVSSTEDRYRRIKSSLRGSQKLLPDLSSETREVLLAWGEEIAWAVVRATEGMDDPAAEEFLQPRIRALRRMLQRIGQMIASPQELEADVIRYVAKQAGLIAGMDVMSQVPEPIVVDFWAERQHQAGTPLDQVEVMRRFVAQLLAIEPDESGLA